ncbi:NADH-quinone oxidoreductase subunit N [Actinoplanes italicus]|uniref:NADH-quinone oxidoreductase subunit N n=1 Tax=Actinoplanes italicus TaxID=113567 RepID=A0A2T0KQC7_9ACTN|nr:proton-conducting transporter membrane subunit [Actinoplanes italicus]PRX25942.1 NADH dehydrogenase subunit N [Actinoplanes italicus]GIE33526.1 NADH-quinone oxidoreductase subunit N [Actinoplanes italicus]
MRSQAVDHIALLPLYAAAGTAVLALLADLFVGRRAVTVWATALGALATGVCALAVGPWDPTFCAIGGCSWVPTWPAAVAAALFAGLTAGVLALSEPSLRIGTAPAGEFCFLLACSMTGGVTVAYAGDLLTLIVGLETLTLPLYVLVGLRRFAPSETPSSRPAQSAVTFFLISVVSTAIALLGIALNHAATGILHLSLLGPAPAPFTALANVGAALLVVGLAFKVAAVPLHAWAPATYDGAPIPIAAYLSTASKLGGVLALAAVVARLDAGAVMSALAVLTMTVGNLVALRQIRMVRLLAWSSVAQAGYILAALAMGAAGVAAALAYAAFFVVLELIAFAVVVALRPAQPIAPAPVPAPAAPVAAGPASAPGAPGAATVAASVPSTLADVDGGTLDDYRGAARRHPWLGAAFVLAMAGLAGLPPGLAGLFAKVSVVEALVGEGWIWLAAVVVVNAVIALAYYVRVAALFYTVPSHPGIPVADPGLVYDATHPRHRVARPITAVLLATTAVAVVLGFLPQLLFNALP